MDNFWTISISDILTIVIAFSALIAATLIGIRQNLINKRLLNLQDSVELYIECGGLTKIDTKKEIPELIVPTIIIRNLSTKIVYLNKYLYNGTVYPTYDKVIPPVSLLANACYYIELPTNSETHVSFQILFYDWTRNKWETSGYADLINGQWICTNTPCKRYNFS